MLYHGLSTGQFGGRVQSEDTCPDALIVDGGELGIDGVFAFAVLEQLTEGKEGSTLEEHFCNDASGTEDVHWLCDAVVGVGLVDGDLVCLVEALRGEVAGASTAGIVEKGKVGGVVEREPGGFVGGKVGEVDPV